MNKNVAKHNLVSIETGDRKEVNKLVHTKKGWVKLSFAFITTSMALLTFGISNPVSANEVSNTTPITNSSSVTINNSSKTTTSNELAASKSNDSTNNSNSENISKNNNATDSNNLNKNQVTNPSELSTSKVDDSTNNSNSENISKNNDATDSNSVNKDQATTPSNLATIKSNDSRNNSNSEDISKNNSVTDSNNANKDQVTTPSELSTSKVDDSANNSNSENISENNVATNQQLSNSLINLSASYTQNFIDQVTPGAIAGWKKYGVLPSISIAQAIIESGWGKSTLATQGNNLFGIKGSYNGQSIYLPTQEYINGQWVTVNAAFRKYPNWSASIEDHGAFLHDNSRYNNLIGVKDYVTVANDLHIDGYATAPNYAQSLINCVDSYDLTKIDQEAFSGGSTPTPTPSTPTVTPSSGTYTFSQTTNIRTAPSLNSQVIGQYEAGQSVTYNGIVQADGYTWLRYTSYSGEYHYVAELGGNTPTPSTPTVTPAYGTYTFNQTTNIRTAPSLNSQVIGQYEAGQSVTYNGIVKADGYTWLRYTSYSGEYHYVAEL